MKKSREGLSHPSQYLCYILDPRKNGVLPDSQIFEADNFLLKYGSYFGYSDTASKMKIAKAMSDFKLRTGI